MPRIDHALKDHCILNWRSVMKTVYRGVSQTIKPVSRSKKSVKLAKTYRGVTYNTLAKETRKLCEHTYRGCFYMA